jgi:23S rRNA (cytidine1920-2'-O)/16S rRNA (cytidine1409-2'-O)-methyltransferase
MKLRLDQLLVERGLAETRTKAQALIMAGLVYQGEKKLDKAGQQFDDKIEITVRGKEHPWVSRGGIKLAHAIDHFKLKVKDEVVADIGSSTGGFTDVLLHHGAAKVYAVDVGHGQLDVKLRNDNRVVVMEETNARNLTSEQIPDALDSIVCDASFISLKKVLPAVLALAKPNAKLIALIKPQFEVGKEIVSRGKGVVRDAAIHQAVCADISEWISGLNWEVKGTVESPVTGPKGNKEFLLFAVRNKMVQLS